MEKHDTTSPTKKSGKEVAKSGGRVSKFAPAYWRDRIFRPTYQNETGTQEVQELWCRIQHGGRREAIGLGSNDKDQAARTAAKLFTRIKAAGWAVALAEFDPDRHASKGVPTVGDVIEAALAANAKALGADHHAAENSMHGYVNCFRKLAAEACGLRADAGRFDYVNGGNAAWLKRVHAIRLDKITADRIEQVRVRRMKAAAGNPLAEKRAKVTFASTLRQAKSLFSKDRPLQLEGLVNPFAGLKAGSGTPTKYASTVNAGDLMRSAKQDLAQKHPESYKAFLLALGAGLRAGEIDNLQWQHIDAKAGTIRAMTTATFDTKTESSQREVFVDAGLIAELEHYRNKATALYVLESDRKPKPNAKRAEYRAEATFDHLKKWLRAHGITAHKPIHTLRKEFGSLVTQSADLLAASRQLGHASIATTAAYYAENRKRVAPQIGDMLKPQPTTAKGKAAK